MSAFCPRRFAEAALGVMSLAFGVIDEGGESILNFEQLTLYFGPENAPCRRDVRLAGSDVLAMRGHSERSSSS